MPDSSADPDSIGVSPRVSTNGSRDSSMSTTETSGTPASRNASASNRPIGPAPNTSALAAPLVSICPTPFSTQASGSASAASSNGMSPIGWTLAASTTLYSANPPFVVTP